MKKLLYFLLVPAFALAQSTNQNYTKATTYRGASGTLPQTTVTYFDGLGRPIQKIDNAQSGTGNNIVTHIAYDAYGRPVKEYLPYGSGTSTLDYISGAAGNQSSYYTNTANGETTSFPYSEKVLEASPLDRVLKQAAPGEAWKVGSGHEIQFEYGTNVASGTDAVKLFKATASWNSSLLLYTTAIAQSSNYGANELYLTITKDENWTSGNNHTTQEFKDKAGKVVLKRTFNAGTAHETYYVYDQFGNLSYVIPPLANAAYDSTTLDGLCYQYQYDNRNRLVSKKLPGKQWEFIVYDTQDRPVATGPAFSPWGAGTSGMLVTQYDVFGRVTQTGWVAMSVSQSARASHQTTLNGGSNPFTLATNDILSKNYYDNYGYSDAPTLPSDVEGQTVNTAVKGQPTGSWARILTTATETMGELSYTLYDNKMRPIRSHTDNYLGGYTEVDSKLDFMGKTLYTLTRHKRTDTDTETLVTDTFTYTVQDRLATHVHQIDGGDVQLLADNTYDELGQLKSKKVGGSATYSVALQQVDYQYNIRGWLKSINDVTSLISTDLGSPDDLFAFKINYNQTENAAPLFNGNISETFWRTMYDDQQRKYEYAYDHLNRLLQADYSRPDSKNVKNAYKEQLTYDKNGNILTLKRNGGYEGEDYDIEIDDLSYAYDTSKKNQLLRVTDASGMLEGFSENMDNDGNTANDDYAYDANGNMTADANKGITNIKYNHLNLPFSITFANPHNKVTKIEYLYDAVGKKVAKKVHYYEPGGSGGGGSEMKGGTVPTNSSVGPATYVQKMTQTDYLAGGFQYKDEALDLIPHAEGFIKLIEGDYVYHFNYTDHLGNVRLTYKDKGGVSIVEESNYYPFGLEHSGYNNPDRSAKDWGNIVTGVTELDYKYKFQGQELQDELGLNVYDYGARNYDPAIGRWMNIDPLSEVSRRWSPYTYCYNNPLIFTDPDGMLATPPTDLYGMSGKLVKHIEDGKSDKKLILTSGTEKTIAGQTDSEISENLSGGGYGADVVNVPSNEIISKMDEAFRGTDKDGLERGFVVATDGSSSDTKTGKEGSVRLDDEVKKMNDSGKQSSYDGHTHGVGKITVSSDGTVNVEGGNKRSPEDRDDQDTRETSGTYNHPSFVLGYEVDVEVASSGSGSIGSSTTSSRSGTYTTKTRTINYYTGARNTTVDYNKFKKAVGKINN